jgi:hypothetical protein
LRRLCGAAAVLAIVPALAAAAPHCFSSASIDGWRVADAKTVYLRADVSRIYRMDLSHECETLRVPDVRLVIRQRTGDVICSATDIDLRAGDLSGGPPEPCFLKSMTELSPAEAAALPKKFRP